VALPQPLEGTVRVEIPAGALTQDTEVSLSLDQGSLVPRAGEWSGLCLVLTAANTVQFNQPVHIAVPVKPEYAVLAGYFVDEDGSLDAIQASGQDKSAMTQSFDTFRPGRFTWIGVTE
jgi:hypothetical protein